MLGLRLARNRSIPFLFPFFPLFIGDRKWSLSPSLTLTARFHLPLSSLSRHIAAHGNLSFPILMIRRFFWLTARENALPEMSSPDPGKNTQPYHILLSSSWPPYLSFCCSTCQAFLIPPTLTRRCFAIWLFDSFITQSPFFFVAK